MRTRHRIPTIFNLSMVDVLCCALGCVILLWLVNFREAKRRTLAAGETADQLARTRARLDAATEDMAEARRRLAAFDQQVRDLQSQREAALAKNSLANQTAYPASRPPDGNRGPPGEANPRRSKAGPRPGCLSKRPTALQDLLRKQDSRATAAAKTADELAERLRDTELQAKKLRGQLPTLQDELKKYRDQTASADSRSLSMQKELTQARSRIDLLLNEKKLLGHQVARARADAENRFAGIALTGRRVVFLVDMSGSMEYVDGQTTAPGKWAAVRETLLKIARSLPELEKFQVILFAREASFPLGGDGRWLSYDPKGSMEQIAKALTATKPKGATNMYAAFDAAFRFRAEGLDTIYVLSDGLPNVGPGLTAEQTKLEGNRPGRGAWAITCVRCCGRPGTARRRTGRGSASTPSASFTRAPMSVPSFGPWPARTTAVSSA